MGKKGSVLIMAFLVVMVITILLTPLFLKAMNESSMVKRFINSTRAFWVAEAGVATAVANMPNNVSGSLDSNPNYLFSANTHLLSGNFFQIDSTGSVTLPGGGSISRSITAVAETFPVNPDNFQHAIRTTGNLRVQGNVTITGPQEEFASINFQELFGHTTAQMRSYADYLYSNPPVSVTPVEGITWVDLSPGEELRISADTWRGGIAGEMDEAHPSDMSLEPNVDNGAILIVSGDAQITGGTYYGIIYVIGKLRMSGNAQIYGTILAESGAEIDTTITGTVDIIYDTDAIVNSLSPLGFINPAIVSWKEN